MTTSPPRKTQRCAIYTRKSSDEGLDQEFNSLHAQKDACEAYITSQVSEGWRALKTAYDDGGFSGGSMDRPGLAALLRDAERGLLDVVVVYKVDRLTRSLGDFARIVEIFDRHGVSFVSVTQAFNTTTSMGRLTLNVLLSFAQFEREVTGERIRDKIAASKAKGMWMGGRAPFGYDPSGRTLVINPVEAEQVREIFKRYLTLGSVYRLVDELGREGRRTKLHVTKAGKTLGGKPFARGGLFHLLSNRVYLGEIPHKGVCYPGLHPPIVDRELFEAAGALLAEHRRRHNDVKPRRAVSPLIGRLFDAAGEPMTPTTAAGKSGRRYRYYVSASRQRGRPKHEHLQRVSASQLEAFVRAVVARLSGTSMKTPSSLDILARVDLRQGQAVLSLTPDTLRSPQENAEQTLNRLSGALMEGERMWWTPEGDLAIQVPLGVVLRGGRTWIESSDQDRQTGRRRPNKALIAGLKQGQRLVRSAKISPLQPSGVLAHATGIDDPYQRKLAAMAFLAPDIQEAILAGRQPAHLTLQTFIDQRPPMSWSEQRRTLGFV